VPSDYNTKAPIRALSIKNIGSFMAFSNGAIPDTSTERAFEQRRGDTLVSIES
jgi:hypothetical protein